MNLPNKLTTLRVLLVPLFMVFAQFTAIPYSYLIAFLVFTAAAITDFFDGKIAREQNQITDFGKFADPLADKLLTTTAFIYMLVDGVCSPVVLIIILTREFAVSGVRMVAAGNEEGEVIAANNWGKAKTVVQMVSIIMYYFFTGVQQTGWLPVDIGAPIYIVTHTLCWVVAAITAFSGLLYLWQYRQYINTAK